MLDSYRLNGEIAFVTGGGCGIGRAVCLTLADAGADIVVADLREHDAKAVAAEVEEFGRRAIPLQVDVTQRTSVERAVRAAIEEFAAIDILCNIAGVVAPPRPFVESDPDAWRQEIDVNFLGTAHCTWAVLPHMIEKGGGRIVNTASDAARVGEVFSAIYAGAKSAVIAFSKSVAREVARSNVRVNCISPGATRTKLAERAGVPQELFERSVKSYPLGRLGEASDQANAVLYFASPASDWVTGQTLSVSGGFTMA